MAESPMKLGLILSATDKISMVVDRAMGKSLKSMSNFQKKYDKMGGNLQKIGMSVIGSGVAVATSLFAMTKTTATHAKEIARSSQKIGMSNEGFQVWAKAASRAGMESDRFESGVAKLSKTMVTAAMGQKSSIAIFKAAGISAKDSTGKLKPTTQVLKEISDKFKSAADGPKKTALAMLLFGKSGKDMIPMLNKGSKSIAELTDEMKKNGEMIDDEGIAKAAEFNKKLREMTDKMEGTKNKIALAVMPAFTRLADKVLEIVNNVTDWITNNRDLVSQLLHWAKIAAIVGGAIWGIGTAIKTVVVISKTVQTVVSVFKAIKLVMWGVTSGYYKMIAAQKISSVWTGIVTAAQWLWNAAFIASPIGWIVLAIGTLVAVLAVCWKKFETFRAVIKTIWEVVKGFGGILKDYVVDRIKGIITGLGSLGRAIGLLFKGKFSAAGSEALKGVKALSGYDAKMNAMRKSVTLVQSIQPTYSKILAAEKSGIHNNEKAAIQVKNKSKVESIYSSNQSKIDNKISTTKNTQNSPALNYTYNVNINGGNSGDVDSFKKMLQKHKDEITNIVKGSFKNDLRVSYNK